MHFTPTSSSRLNLAEHFFAEITRKRIRRGVIIVEFAILSHLAEHNEHPKPFVWAAKAVVIVKKAQCGTQAMESQHAFARSVIGRMR
jgi:hypothetical protein